MIELQDLTKFYGNFRALNNINLKVEKGEILGLLGPNGAGKTTAMRIISCFIPATSGTAKVAGFDVFEDSMQVRRHLGYLPETPPVYFDMTVGSYLSFVGDIREIPTKEKNERIGKVCERLGLSQYHNRLIGTLSKGYRQRVGLAQAMLHNPDVLILDEPTVGLDPTQIIEIRDLVKDLAVDHTVILSTHILSEVSATCNRVVIINEGEIVAEDSVSNLENNSIGKPTWKISLKSSDINATIDSIKSFEGSEILNPSEANNSVTFNLNLNDPESFDSWFAFVTSKGYIFREITPIKASLEDIFIKLTASEQHTEDKKEANDEEKSQSLSEEKEK